MTLACTRTHTNTQISIWAVLLLKTGKRVIILPVDHKCEMYDSPYLLNPSEMRGYFSVSNFTSRAVAERDLMPKGNSEGEIHKLIAPD